ncbi:3-oxoacyl-reductase [Aaosphaeria arxii CBS 175.79]|uniref:3-oxoacyl-[acyl-carrier-protein] reductase n=1 Tax=Aaosphaeria arxii CBS 175.79 TaxID=1450172 RepID=A0A6A5Y329_9PLEO|nr:3-oxoacyl-reductase [Aaosphaeria arxii CBS 175.79]KAF2019838.1 3-oxoacyl-reductase [Aaosphaeria arxii CBS 175.79]
MPKRNSINTIRGTLSGQIALVTGATGGIGASICRMLAVRGCSVAMHYFSDQDGAIELMEEFKEEYMHRFGSKFASYKADLGNYDEVRELHEHVVDIVGPPTILINNAGANGGHSGVKSVDEVPIEAFENTWRVNCGSAYLLTQLCMPAMEGEGWGRIIFISSVAGFTGGIVGPHYASAKSALHGLVHWLAQTYAKKGVTVNGVAPALIEQTKMLPGSSEELAEKLPVGRLGYPDEVAGTVLWMLETSYVTNKVIGVDGGMFPQ